MRRLALTGFAIWAGATIALRLAGQVMFRRLDALNVIVLLAVSLVVMIWVARQLLPASGTVGDRAASAIALVSPGMLLDAASAIWFQSVFPNIRGDAAGVFGGWLLFCNLVVLMVAVLPEQRRSPDRMPTL